MSVRNLCKHYIDGGSQHIGSSPYFCPSCARYSLLKIRDAV